MRYLVLFLYISSFIAYLLSTFNKKEIFQRIGTYTLFCGFLGNCFLVISHILKTYRFPLVNTSETLLVGVSIAIFIFFISQKRAPQVKFTQMGALISALSIAGVMLSQWVLKGPPMPLLPALQTRLLVFHVASCIVAYSLFLISFITAVISFRGFTPDIIYLKRLCHRCVCLGFCLLSIGIILGSLWGRLSWGHWWNWDPKEIWALITWLVYGSYIYRCLNGIFSERQLIIISIAGFILCLFTYLGVNYLLRGLHSYA